MGTTGTIHSLWLGWRSYTLSVNGDVAAGTVVRLVEDDHSDYFTDIYPVVEFEVDGNAYSVRSQNNYRWWNRYIRFPIGKQSEALPHPTSSTFPVACAKSLFRFFATPNRISRDHSRLCNRARLCSFTQSLRE